MSTLTETREALPTGTWNVDPVHSQVGFAVDYMVGTFRGSFSPVEAKLDVAEDGQASIEGSANVAGIRVQDDNLTAHLLSPEFFDAERTPEIRFASSDISRTGDEIVAQGELSIKGHTEPVELRGKVSEPAEDAYGNERIGLELATTVDRTKFGLDWNLPLPNGKPALANDVTITSELNLVRA